MTRQNDEEKKKSLVKKEKERRLRCSGKFANGESRSETASYSSFIRWYER